MAEEQKSNQSPKDHWSSEAYKAFVPQLQTVLRYLDPQPTDRVLDIGCGDGRFTDNYLPAVAYVLGIDASPSMIDHARKAYGSPRAEFRIVDCRYLERETSITEGTWDKVVSNAALHWIFRDASTRISTLQAIHSCLKPGGHFVFELGGHGNVGEVVTAFLWALVHNGVTIESAREAIPWYFPSQNWMKKVLEELGFQVEKLEVEYRPTEITKTSGGGLPGWIRLFAAQTLDVVPAERREIVVREVCDILDKVITHEEDGSQWLGYVRLRGVARKNLT
ncbi:hypothetical protein Egran_05318 [Elaphomyces granulatus]|uniref:Methyltransferase domain-containing protein n=1 Tax=Elaphomyces granulatus TaxID=519963 RepID=A0A232LRY0_9EURO|nr:hypothetical protein Egran_05318 [Elaphomyces granulatus]